MKQGEVWKIILDSTVEAEIKNNGLCVIVNNNLIGRLPLKIVVPLIEWKDKYPRLHGIFRLKVPERTGSNRKPLRIPCGSARCRKVN